MFEAMLTQGIGNSMPGNFESLPFTVSVKPSELHKFGGNCGANCYLTMPFNKRARVVIENQGENPYIQVSQTGHRVTSRSDCSI